MEYIILENESVCIMMKNADFLAMLQKRGWCALPLKSGKP